MDQEIFFLDKGSSASEAKRICAECPVRSRCLDYAIERNEEHGVWGGMAEKERREELRRRRRLAAIRASEREGLMEASR